MVRNSWALLGSLVILVFLHARGVVAEGIDLPPEKEAIAQQIFVATMSPFCVARSLQDCPSGAAHDLKEKIRGQLAAGKSREEITAELFATYGDKVRSVPEAAGFGLFGWLAPFGFLLLGGIVLWIWIRARTKASASTVVQPTSVVLDPEMQKRIDEELSKF